MQGCQTRSASGPDVASQMRWRATRVLIARYIKGSLDLFLCSIQEAFELGVHLALYEVTLVNT